MLIAELVEQADDDMQSLVLFFFQWWLRGWLGFRRFRRQRLLRHRQRRDDAVACFGLFEVLVQVAPNAGAERNVVTAHQAVVNDLVPERQQDRLRQDRQIRPDQVLERLRQRQNAVCDGGVRGREEHRVLLQFTEDVEPAVNEVPPRTHDGEFVFRQMGRVFIDKGLDQVGVGEKGIADFEPDLWR